MKKHRTSQLESENTSLNLGRYINILADNIKFISIIVIIMSITAFVASYLIPKKYNASSSISVEENIVSDLVQGIAITTSLEAKIRLLEVQLLSRNVIMQVASLLEIDLDANTAQEKEILTRTLRDNISIRHDKRRGVFYINFIDSNPVVARDFVNTLIRVYIEQNTSEKRKESFDATDFLGNQIDIFQARIDEAQKNIDTFKSEKGLFLSLDEGFLQQQISTLDKQIESIAIQKNKLLSERYLLSDSSKIMEELREKERQLHDAQAIYTSKHPILRRLTVEVENAKKRLEQAQTSTESVNPQYQSIQIELKSLEETEESLTKERNENLKNLEALPAIKTQLRELEQAKHNENIIYQQLVSRFGQSEVSKQMELQDKSVSFKVIDSAVTPTDFIFPKRHIVMLGGIVAGFALAISILIGLSFLQPKIHSAEELSRYSVPVLVKLPIISKPEALAKKRFVNFVFIFITTMVIAFVCAAAALEFLGIRYIERFLSF